MLQRRRTNTVFPYITVDKFHMWTCGWSRDGLFQSYIHTLNNDINKDNYTTSFENTFTKYIVL